LGLNVELQDTDVRKQHQLVGDYQRRDAAE
jgi:hypothetical protein